MQPDAARAHAAALREWADTWERSAIDRPTGGETELAFQMRRTARLIDKIVGDESPDVVETTLAESPIGAFRDG